MDDFLPDEPDMRGGGASYFPELESKGPSPIFLALIGLLVAAAVGVGTTYWVTERRGTSGLNLVERSYTRMWRFADWLGVPSPPDQTPYERADALTTIVPEGESTISRITGMYVIERFGRGNGNGDSSEAEGQWSLLRPLLWRTWIQKKFSRFQRQQRHRWQDFSQSPKRGSQAGKGPRGGSEG
jgi:hypothetical protein